MTIPGLGTEATGGGRAPAVATLGPSIGCQALLDGVVVGLGVVVKAPLNSLPSPQDPPRW